MCSRSCCLLQENFGFDEYLLYCIEIVNSLSYIQPGLKVDYERVSTTMREFEILEELNTSGKQFFCSFFHDPEFLKKLHVELGHTSKYFQHQL